jgi:hypothetical protein
MSEGKTDSKDVVEVKEDKIGDTVAKEIVEKLKPVFENFDNRLKQLETVKAIPQLEQPKQDAMSNPLVQMLMAQAFKGEGNNEFGTKENLEFFATVGKSDFDAFRLMQQRRLMKLLETANKAGA